jgi:hypothetical protein
LVVAVPLYSSGCLYFCTLLVGIRKRMMGPKPIPIPEFFTPAWYDLQKQLYKTDPVIARELFISKPLLEKWKRAVGCKPYKYRHMKGMSWEEKQEILILRKQGLTMRQIAEKVGKSPSTIQYQVKRNAS